MNYLDRIKRIRSLREDHDLTQAELGKKLKISQRLYSYYENGQRSVPLEIICDLADIYHTSTDYILGRVNDKK